MPGPPAREPGRAARRNKKATGETLDAPAKRKKPPALPQIKGRRWHPLTREWWRKTWESPLSARYLDVDVSHLKLLAILIDNFWHGETELAGEIRLQRRAFGQTLEDRNRLGVRIVPGGEKSPATPKRPTGGSSGGGADPRRGLHAVP